MERVTLNFVLLICLFTVSCDKKQKIDLRGAWKVEKDSSLIVIYDHDFFLHSKPQWDLYLKYVVSGDSLELSDDSIPVWKRKLMLISKDEFIVTDSVADIRVSRIKTQVDTAKLRSLVSWLRKTKRFYSDDDLAEHARKSEEAEELWRSMVKAGR
jgi:hypothetical protein